MDLWIRDCFKLGEQKHVATSGSRLRVPTSSVCSRVEWCRTFLRFSKTGTMLLIRYIFMIPKNRRIWPCVRQSLNFQKITGTLKINIFFLFANTIPSFYFKEQSPNIKCIIKIWYLFFFFQKWAFFWMDFFIQTFLYRLFIMDLWIRDCFKLGEQKHVATSGSRLRVPTSSVCSRVEWCRTFLRFSKTGTMLLIRYIFMIPKNRRIWPCVRQSLNFQKITGTLKINIFFLFANTIPSFYFKEQSPNIKCIIKIWYLFFFFQKWAKRFFI